MKEDALKPLVAVIDDETQLRRLLRMSLEANGYQVVEAASAQQGLSEVAKSQPDVILLDLGLPDMDGMDVLARLREWTDIPIIILSVRNGEEDIIRALQNGADDYVTKPFSTGELMARLEAACRRIRPSGELAVFQAGPLEVDLAFRTVKVNGRPVKLTETEYSLLRLFVRNAGKVLTHPQILETVWGPANIDKTHYLHVYMTHLREKIETNPARPELLLTETRVGYRLNDKFTTRRAAPTPVAGQERAELGASRKLETV